MTNLDPKARERAQHKSFEEATMELEPIYRIADLVQRHRIAEARAVLLQVQAEGRLDGLVQGWSFGRGDRQYEYDTERKRLQTELRSQAGVEGSK